MIIDIAYGISVSITYYECFIEILLVEVLSGGVKTLAHTVFR
jgi:hypothetical protein